jgi:uncharacterized protein YecE (DUF72 family)
VSQLGLFGDPDHAELERIARAIPTHVRFGTSSWTFEGWKGIVYHDTYTSKHAFVQRSLAEYAAWPLFRTVGIDRSYYAPLEDAELSSYAAQLPRGFRCVSKVWSGITSRVFGREHARAGEENPSFLDPIAFSEQVAPPLLSSFADHLGPLILELSPAPGMDSDPAQVARAIERFLAKAPEGFSYAFELREPQLLSPRYLDVIRAHPSASHVLNFHTNMPPIGAQLDRGALVGRAPVVARLMVPPGKRYAEMKEAFTPFDRLRVPQPGMRRDVVRLVDMTAERGIELYVIANNKAEGSSPLTVRALATMLVGR